MTGCRIPDAGCRILDTIVNDIEKSHCEDPALDAGDVAISRDCFAGARNDKRCNAILFRSFTIHDRNM